MCRPLGVLSTSDLWGLIRQRQRKGKGNGKDHAVDVCAETARATTTKTTSVASLPFRFQCLELVCFAVIFPPTTLDMRHLTHSGQITQIFRRIALSAYTRRKRRVSLIRAERTVAYKLEYTIHTHSHTHTLPYWHLHVMGKWESAAGDDWRIRSADDLLCSALLCSGLIWGRKLCAHVGSRWLKLTRYMWPILFSSMISVSERK